MPPGQIYTLLFLIAWFLLAGLWDGFAYLTWGPPATISKLLLSWAQEHPIIAFLFGVIFGHLFWPQH